MCPRMSITGFAALLAAALLLVSSPASAQKKLYTRGYRLQDFRSKTTKVVLDGSPSLKKALREDVTSFWTVSPYEFCTPAEYRAGKSGSDCYYLVPSTAKGIVWLSLIKGPDESMTVVSVPVAGADDPAPLLYMPAYLSIIQDYTEAAMASEFKAYLGLGSSARWLPWGMKVIRDPDAAAEAFKDADPGAAVQVLITPDGNPKSRPRRKLVFGASGYELYSFH